MYLKGIKLFSIAFVTTIISIIIGFALILGVYSLPTGIMNKHVLSSYQSFEESYPNTTPRVMGGKLDTFTDALMLLTASYEDDNSIYTKSLLNKRYFNEELGPDQLLYQIGKTLSDDRDISVEGYARYWHGYLVILKPLLMVSNYNGVRFINGIILLALIVLLWRQYCINDEKLYITPLLAIIIFINPVSIILSIQFMGMITVTLLGLFILAKYRIYLIQHSLMLKAFFVVLGSLTAYVDLLTYPLITLGIPLAYWISSTNIGVKSNKQIVQDICLYSIIWGFGYIGMWFGKWMLATLLTDVNIIKDAYMEIIYRTSSQMGDTPISYRKVLSNNFKYCWGNILLLLVLFGGYVSYKKHKDKELLKFDINKKHWPLLIIAIIPFIWYFLVQNHSYIHAWFTYRELVVVIYVVITFCCLGIRERVK